MVITGTQRTVESQGLINTEAFKIKASSKAFKVLSDGLYSNKIRAIIRELSCNAYDAHVANGNADMPFEVKLPSELDTSFYVRDFGTGLSDSDVKTIFTTYFESTKTDSNDFIGALGLGSKSPFSYTDNFTVTSIYNGVKTIYVAFLNEFGAPSMSTIGSEETSEANGVTIEFSVRDEDIYSFKREASIVFSVFKTHPTILGASINIVSVYEGMETAEYRGPDWAKLSDHNLQANINAIQGNIAYPIDPYSLKLEHGNFVLRFLSVMRGLVIEFPIGSLDVSASRETISYDAKTIETIVGKVTEICKEIITQSLSEFKDMNAWEAAIVASKKGYAYNSFYSILKECNETLKVTDTINFPSPRISIGDLVAGMDEPLRKRIVNTELKISENKRNTIRSVKSKFGERGIVPSEIAAIVYKDMPVKNETRYYSAFVRKQRSSEYVWCTDDYAIVKLFESLGCPSIVKMSDMPNLITLEKNVSVKTNLSERIVGNHYFKSAYRNDLFNNWRSRIRTRNSYYSAPEKPTTEDKDVSNRIIYATKEDIELVSKHYELTSYGSKIDSYVTIFLPKTKKDMAIIQQNPKDFINIVDALKELYAADENDYILKSQITQIKTFGNLVDKYLRQLNEEINHTVIGNYLETSERAKQTSFSNTLHVTCDATLAFLFGWTPKEKVEDANIHYETMYEKFPLLKYISAEHDDTGDIIRKHILENL